MKTLVICSPEHRQPIASALHLPAGEVVFALDIDDAMDYYCRERMHGNRITRFVCDSIQVAAEMRDFATVDDESVMVFEGGKLERFL